MELFVCSAPTLGALRERNDFEVLEKMSDTGEAFPSNVVANECLESSKPALSFRAAQPASLTLLLLRGAAAACNFCSAFFALEGISLLKVSPCCATRNCRVPCLKVTCWVPGSCIPFTNA